MKSNTILLLLISSYLYSSTMAASSSIGRYITSSFRSYETTCNIDTILSHNFNKDTATIDETGIGIFGRKVIYRNHRKLPLAKNGIIDMKICINRSGKVIYSELNKEATTITDKKILKRALKAALGYKFEPNILAPQIQCGKLRINFNGLPNYIKS